jgi:uncharacterized membrane protein
MTTATAAPAKYRIESIDIVRGLVMLIMAIDHVRDFVHQGQPEPTDLATTTGVLFFTRWMTHFCAPTFVFLSGVSAYLAGTRRTENQLGIFLLKRGIWLIVVELVFMALAMTANPLYNVFIFQVIWAIGASMVLLGLLVLLKTPVKVIAAIGLILFLGHDVFDFEKISFVENTFLGKLLFSGQGFGTYWPVSADRGFIIAYALLPWAGVMFLGYAFGQLYRKSYDAVKRRKTLLYTGLATLLFFVIFRYFNIYGDPSPWAVQKTTTLSIISFFNVSKYPPSLLYLCMTIGTALVLLSVTENVKNRFTDILVVYGNVPFFYYLCHWYLVRTISIIVFFAQGFTTSQIVTPHVPFLFFQRNMGFNLLGVYITWIFVITVLYLPCRWFGRYKKTHQQWWLSYL